MSRTRRTATLLGLAAILAAALRSSEVTRAEATPQGPRRGDGAEPELNAARGHFDAFNREQQAMIIQHCYVHRYVDMLSCGDYAPRQPYADVAHV